MYIKYPFLYTMSILTIQFILLVQFLLYMSLFHLHIFICCPYCLFALHQYYFVFWTIVCSFFTISSKFPRLVGFSSQHFSIRLQQDLGVSSGDFILYPIMVFDNLLKNTYMHVNFVNRCITCFKSKVKYNYLKKILQFLSLD